MMSWTRKSDSIDEAEALSARVYNAIMENFHYGKKEMDSFRRRANDIMRGAKQEQIMLSYEHVLTAFREGVIAYDTENSFPRIWFPRTYEVHLAEHYQDPVWFNYLDEEQVSEPRVLCSFGPTRREEPNWEKLICGQ